MKKFTLFLFLLSSINLYAAWGLFDADRSYIGLNVAGTPSTKTVWSSGAGTPATGFFNGADFGTFSNGQTFQLNAYDIKTWKNSGGDVTGGKFYYVIYPTGSRPTTPSFTAVNLGFIANLGSDNQKWGVSGLTTDLLNGLLPGAYSLEIYAEMYGNNPTKIEYDGNNGSNYIATFKIAPSAFNVTGGGSYCQGSGGLPVGLDGSESGVTYTISPGNETVAGTGSAITFGNRTAGTYTISGSNTGGTTAMTGSAVITETPTVTPAVSIVANFNPVTSGTSVAITATPTNGGVTPQYQFYINNALYSTQTNPSLSIAPTVGTYDIYVIMTPDPTLTCFSPATAISNTINLVVNASPATSTWTGGGNDQNWHTAANWDNGIPGSTTAVTIPSDLDANYPTVSNSAICASILIESGASLINNGLLGIPANQATVERLIADGTNDKWHLFISPVTNNIAATGTSCFNGAWLDRYNEPTGAWVRLETGDNVVPSYGYSINYLAGSRNLVFPGNLKTSPLSYINLSYTSGAPGYGFGYNLIGNPYTCGISTALLSVPTGMTNAAYVWNVPAGNYTTLTFGSGSSNPGIIASLQGFFVQTNSGTNSLTLANAAKVHGGTFLKSSDMVADMLKIKIEGNTYYDETFVRFHVTATEGFDQEYDASKLAGLDEAPQLYSILPDEKAAINTLPSYTANQLVPLGLKVGAETTYTITISGTESFDPTLPIRLDDLKLGTSLDVRYNPTYSFTAAPGDAENRFRLRFASAIGIDESPANNFSIFAAQGLVHVTPIAEASGTVYVYSASGQLVAQAALTGGETLLRVAATGVYVVKVVTENSIVTQKVVVTL